MLSIVLDENIPTSLVGLLELEGYRVCHIGMISHGISDHDVLSFCSKENSILVTQDSDFGTMIFFGTSKHDQSIIYLKYTSFADRLIVKDFVIDLLKSIDQGFYYTITSKQMRKRPLK